MKTQTQGRGKRFAALALTMFVIFALALLARGWWSLRPVGGAHITAAGPGAALVAAGSLPVFAPGEGSLPGPLAALARLHVYKTKWVLFDNKGVRHAVKSRGNPFSTMAPAPVALGREAILYAAGDDRVAVAGLDGTPRGSYRTAGLSVRALAACGARAVWTAAGRVRMRTVFRLYMADAALAHVDVAENTDALFPMLGPGALGCGTDGTVYFTGHDPEDHARRVTYGVTPGLTRAVPVAMESDWGALFAVSPDGAAAASAGSRGVTLTRTATGKTIIIASVAPADPAKPAWSADGKNIAVFHRPARLQRTAKGLRNNAGAPARVIIIDTAKKKVRVRSAAVANFSCGPCEPVWAPGGGRVFINGVRFEKRSAGMLVTRHAVLCFDIKTGKLVYPEDPARLWR